MNNCRIYSWFKFSRRGKYTHNFLTGTLLACVRVCFCVWKWRMVFDVDDFCLCHISYRSQTIHVKFLTQFRSIIWKGSIAFDNNMFCFGSSTKSHTHSLWNALWIWFGLVWFGFGHYLWEWIDVELKLDCERVYLRLCFTLCVWLLWTAEHISSGFQSMHAVVMYIKIDSFTSLHDISVFKAEWLPSLHDSAERLTQCVYYWFY